MAGTSHLSAEAVREVAALCDLGRFVEAESRLRSLIVQHPQIPFLYDLLVAALAGQQKPKEMAAACRETLRLDPSHASAHNNLGVALQTLGDREGAVASYRKAVKYQPDFVEAYSNLGVLLRELGRPEEAVAACRHALKVMPNDAAAHNNLGNALLDLDRMDEAVARYRKAIKIRPDYAEAHNNMANVFQRQGRLEDAVASYRQALQLNPAYAEAHNNLGVVLQELGRLKEAVASYREAIRLWPDYAGALCNLSIALRDLGHPEEAVTSCRRALEIRPDYALAHNNLGLALRQLGKLEEAAASYRRALEIEPDYAEVRSNLAYVLVDLGKNDEALSHIEEALRLQPNDPSARHMHAALTGETTKTAPEVYVSKLFDGYAETFDHHLVKVLNYDAPNRLADLLRRALPQRRRFTRALDLGCGTGLSGTAFREFTEHLTGVDLSRKMIARAREKGIYDQLIHCGVLEFLAQPKKPFDLFIGTDVLIYLGAFEPLLEAISRRSARGAVVCFSTEKWHGDGYKLLPTGRYAHSEAYLLQCAATRGFSAMAQEDIILRYEKERPIDGQLFVLERTNLR